jgi:hypothetical protein
MISDLKFRRKILLSSSGWLMLVHAYVAVDWGGESLSLIRRWRKAGPLTVPWLGMASLRAPTLLHHRYIPFLPTTFGTTLTSILKMEAVLFFRNVGFLIRSAASHSLFVLYDYSACDMCQCCLDRRYSRNSEVMTCFIALVNCDGRTLSRRILQVKIRDRTF